jgi:ribonuclease VapC
MLKQPGNRRKPNVDNVVLDSSVVLALILKERGGQRLDALLAAIDRGDDVQVAISGVNWSEILGRLHRDHPAMAAFDLAALLSGVELVPFGRQEAEGAADYVQVAPSLSLGDRACLALASARKATVWTTDKVWARVNTGVDLEVLR